MNNLTISDYLMLRRTVDVLYDVQDVRMRTANRLRLMPKKTSKVYVAPLLEIEKDLTKEIERSLLKIPIYDQWLQQVKGIGPRITGSIIAHTMIRFERVSATEYKRMMSQNPDETQKKGASQKRNETHDIIASHGISKNHQRFASQADIETHEKGASQRPRETHQTSASHPMSENQPFPASHKHVETHDIHASQSAGETHSPPASHVGIETHSRNASHQIGETQGGAASHMDHDTQRVIAFSQEQLELAQKTDRGEYLIPVLRGIGSFDTVSQFWAWWGLHVVDGKAPKRSRGDRINWNSTLRTLAWKIGKQFVLQGEYYRKVYDEYKQRISAVRLPVGICTQYEECLAKMKKRPKPACKGHIDAMARRYAVKIFLSHLWEKWRTLEGLSVRAPYAIDKLGHTTRWLRASG